MKKPSVQRQLEDFEVLCREAGLPVTVQRQVVYEDLIRRCDHPTADQVFETVSRQMPQISRTTVYRVLETLVELGVVRRICHPGTAVRFDGRHEPHHHLVCRECQKVIDYERSALPAVPLPKGKPRGFVVEDYSIQLLGRCAECRKKR
ncbi:MAG: transcriptional repressor [Pirellulales bacterium]|nr:transcriptional repressor [Pirellulales bacterium]